jgi:membrane protein
MSSTACGVTLPLVTLGPEPLTRVLPISWTPAVLNTINTSYTPIVVVIVLGLTTLYKVALPRSPPWPWLLPGALATLIALLLFAFLIGFAVVLGAQLDNAIHETWPVSR